MNGLNPMNDQKQINRRGRLYGLLGAIGLLVAILYAITLMHA